MQPKTHAQFTLRADELDPAEISAVLRIAPSKAWAKGDRYLSASGILEQPWGVWSLSSVEEVNSDRPEDHVAFLLKKLEPVGNKIGGLLENPEYLVQTYVWYVGESGYTIDSSILSRLCRLCKSVNFSFFEVRQEGDAS